eukprot:5347015-Alexandrium_andersonii.AAC.1
MEMMTSLHWLSTAQTGLGLGKDCLQKLGSLRMASQKLDGKELLPSFQWIFDDEDQAKRMVARVADARSMLTACAKAQLDIHKDALAKASQRMRRVLPDGLSDQQFSK